MRGLQIGSGFRDSKSGKKGLQIGTVLGISNQGEEITNRGRDYKSEQELQIGAERRVKLWYF